MKLKLKPSLLTYIVVVIAICAIIGFILLPNGDKVFLIYAIIFSIVTALFDGTILADWLEKRREKKARNPLVED